MRKVGVSPERGILEHHRDAPAAKRVELPARCVEDFASTILNGTLCARVVREQPQDGEKCLALAGARFADDPEAFAFVHFERQVANGGQLGVSDIEADTQVANLE